MTTDMSDAEALVVLDQLVTRHGEAHPTDGAIMLADRRILTDRHAFITETSDQLREAFLRMQEQGLLMLAPGCLNSFIRATNRPVKE